MTVGNAVHPDGVKLRGEIAEITKVGRIAQFGKPCNFVSKSRKEFKTLYGWLAERDALILKGDRKEPLLVLPLDIFLGLIHL